MSTAANITVKADNGTTDVIFSVLEGKSGDNPARWKAPPLGAIPATQPELRVGSKMQGDTKGRVIATFRYPYSVLNSTTGVTTVQSYEAFRFEWMGDLSVPQAVRNEAASQGVNLLASAAFKTMLKELIAAT